jgi:DNA-binding NtrC family response regulator
MKIAIVDDEQDMRQSISQWLTLSGFETETYSSAEDALKSIGSDYAGVVVTDVKMPGMDGVTFLKRLMAQDSGLPVILITGHGDVPMAVEAMRIGAYDFLEKPFNPDRMTELARKASQQRRLTLDNRALRRELSDGKAVMKKLIGSSPEMERLREDILDLGQADSHVLIDGETGTGKTLVAHALHAVGPRASKKFISISCSAWGEEQLSQKLFGPNPDDSLPLVEEARGGTLCLEDVEALPQAAQARLLDTINATDPAGTTSVMRALRVVAISSHLGLAEPAAEVMRKDLYFRLAGLIIEAPALRSRAEDILTLFTHFAVQFAEEYGCPPPALDAGDAANLVQAPWPGNVRQLINLAERAVLQTRRGSSSNILALLMDDGFQATGARGGRRPGGREAAQGARRRLREDADRPRDAPATRARSRAVMQELCPAAADAEREDGEVRH